MADKKLKDNTIYTTYNQVMQHDPNTINTDKLGDFSQGVNSSQNFITEEIKPTIVPLSVDEARKQKFADPDNTVYYKAMLTGQDISNWKKKGNQDSLPRVMYSSIMNSPYSKMPGFGMDKFVPGDNGDIKIFDKDNQTYAIFGLPKNPQKPIVPQGNVKDQTLSQKQGKQDFGTVALPESYKNMRMQAIMGENKDFNYKAPDVKGEPGTNALGGFFEGLLNSSSKNANKDLTGAEGKYRFDTQVVPELEKTTGLKFRQGTDQAVEAKKNAIIDQEAYVNELARQNGNRFAMPTETMDPQTKSAYDIWMKAQGDLDKMKSGLYDVNTYTPDQTGYGGISYEQALHNIDMPALINNARQEWEQLGKDKIEWQAYLNQKIQMELMALSNKYAMDQSKNNSSATSFMTAMAQNQQKPQ
jgi:hypothetical protein